MLPRSGKNKVYQFVSVCMCVCVCGCRQQLCARQLPGSRIPNRLLLRWLLWTDWLYSCTGSNSII